METHYDVLGVASTATPSQIGRAYKRLALVHHPDKPSGSTLAFQRVSEANETLSDPAKRAAYDAHRGLWASAGADTSTDAEYWRTYDEARGAAPTHYHLPGHHHPTGPNRAPGHHHSPRPQPAPAAGPAAPTTQRRAPFGVFRSFRRRAPSSASEAPSEHHNDGRHPEAGGSGHTHLHDHLHGQPYGHANARGHQSNGHHNVQRNGHPSTHPSGHPGCHSSSHSSGRDSSHTVRDGHSETHYFPSHPQYHPGQPGQHYHGFYGFHHGHAANGHHPYAGTHFSTAYSAHYGPHSAHSSASSTPVPAMRAPRPMPTPTPIPPHLHTPPAGFTTPIFAPDAAPPPFPIDPFFTPPWIPPPPFMRTPNNPPSPSSSSSSDEGCTCNCRTGSRTRPTPAPKTNKSGPSPSQPSWAPNPRFFGGEDVSMLMHALHSFEVPALRAPLRAPAFFSTFPLPPLRAPSF